MNWESQSRYLGHSQDVTPTSVWRRERDQNSAAAINPADFDLDGFKRDLMDKFIEDTTAIAQEQEDHKRQVSTKIEDFERLHMRHKATGTDSDAASLERRAII